MNKFLMLMALLMTLTVSFSTVAQEASPSEATLCDADRNPDGHEDHDHVDPDEESTAVEEN
ncbi:MAG: hypothetical protein WD025_00330 [Bacteriovoracaceae bacterium]